MPMVRDVVSGVLPRDSHAGATPKLQERPGIAWRSCCALVSPPQQDLGAALISRRGGSGRA
jgi:hypothetical protein